MPYTINTADQLKPILTGFRKAQGLSQKAMADKLGISQQTYQVLEANPQKVTVDRLLRVLSIMGVKLILSDAMPLNTSSKRQAVSAGKGELMLKSSVLKKRGHIVNKTTKKDAW
ncbi:MAG: helix-turn-helix transcriptional regulator [Kangiellaceae bacterium]|nr:helix-turn-helix transcriptional regulator [Kangiellaceae bacterium]